MSLRPIALGIGVLVTAACGGSGTLAPDGAAGKDGGNAETQPEGDGGDPATTLRSMLAGAWAFDGDGKDHGGQDLELTVDGLTFPAGKFGKGVQFTGQDGSPIAHRNVHDESLDLTTGDFTVSFWINFAHTGSPQFVAVKGWVAEQGWFVGWAQTVWVFGYPPPSRQAKFADPNESPPTGVFHHVIFERSGDTATLYLNGKMLGGITVQDRANPNASSFQVGGYSPGGVSGGQSVVDGVVDDVAIWHRALTASERAYLSTHAVP